MRLAEEHIWRPYQALIAFVLTVGRVLAPPVRVIMDLNRWLAFLVPMRFLKYPLVALGYLVLLVYTLAFKAPFPVSRRERPAAALAFSHGITVC